MDDKVFKLGVPVWLLMEVARYLAKDFPAAFVKATAEDGTPAVMLFTNQESAERAGNAIPLQLLVKSLATYSELIGFLENIEPSGIHHVAINVDIERKGGRFYPISEVLAAIEQQGNEGN